MEGRVYISRVRLERKSLSPSFQAKININTNIRLKTAKKTQRLLWKSPHARRYFRWIEKERKRQLLLKVDDYDDNENKNKWQMHPNVQLFRGWNTRFSYYPFELMSLSTQLTIFDMFVCCYIRTELNEDSQFTSMFHFLYTQFQYQELLHAYITRYPIVDTLQSSQIHKQNQPIWLLESILILAFRYN